METGGVPLATVFANVLAAGILFVPRLRLRDELRLTPRRLADIDHDDLASMIRIGLPAGVQDMVFSLSNLAIQAAINSLDPAVMAGSVTAFTVESNICCCINAFGLAVATFFSQNYSAGNLVRCRRTTWVAMGLNLAGFAWLCRAPLIQIFSIDTVVVAAAVTRFVRVVILESAGVPMEILSNAMRGYGCSLPPAMVTPGCVVTARIIRVFTVFHDSPDFLTLLLIYPQIQVLTTLVLIWFCLRHQRTLRPLTRPADA